MDHWLLLPLIRTSAARIEIDMEICYAYGEKIGCFPPPIHAVFLSPASPAIHIFIHKGSDFACRALLLTPLFTIEESPEICVVLVKQRQLTQSVKNQEKKTKGAKRRRRYLRSEKKT